MFYRSDDDFNPRKNQPIHSLNFVAPGLAPFQRGSPVRGLRGYPTRGGVRSPVGLLREMCWLVIWVKTPPLNY